MDFSGRFLRSRKRPLTHQAESGLLFRGALRLGGGGDFTGFFRRGFAFFLFLPFLRRRLAVAESFVRFEVAFFT
ncbi:hypothetical protein [Pantoea piersonii]|uniref:hypothetical protein n=1 Tax=Pantoea piersonii TaxID=2364647 RepID=UPI0035E3D658